MTPHDYIQTLEHRLQSLEACLTTLISAGKEVLVNDRPYTRKKLLDAIGEVEDAPQRVTRVEALDRLYVTAWKFSKGETDILDLVWAVRTVKQFDGEGI